MSYSCSEDEEEALDLFSKILDDLQAVAESLEGVLDMDTTNLKCHKKWGETKYMIRDTPVFCIEGQAGAGMPGTWHQFEPIRKGLIRWIGPAHGADGLQEYVEVGTQRLPWNYHTHWLEEEDQYVEAMRFSPNPSTEVSKGSATPPPPMPTHKPPPPAPLTSVSMGPQGYGGS